MLNFLKCRIDVQLKIFITIELNNKSNYGYRVRSRFKPNIYIRQFMFGLFQGKENPSQRLAFPI